MEARHDSVLTDEVLRALSVTQGDTIVDATLGGAGHFTKLLASLGEGAVLIGIDADPAAVERAREVYALDRRPERPVRCPRCRTPYWDRGRRTASRKGTPA